MIKQDILDALALKYGYVGTPGQVSPGPDEFGYVWWSVQVRDAANGVYKDTTIAFYVRDEGLGTEDALWSGNEPKKDPVVDQFKVDLLAKIAQIKAAQVDFKIYDIVTINSEDERAILDTYWLVAGKLEKRGYGAYRKVDSSIDFIELA